MATTLADQIAVEEIGPGEYVSKVVPVRLGNSQPIGYGGCTLGIATHAAVKTVPASYRLYSLVGHFHGPASTKEKLYCTVHKTRDTRTFATRRVQVSQVQPNGKKRVCLELLADFQVEEPALLTFSAPPKVKYSGPEKSHSLLELADRAVADGVLDAKAAAQVKQSFAPSETFLEARFCPEGISGQNVMGAAKHVGTTQDHLHTTERTTGDWTRVCMPLETYGERIAATAFMLDGALSIMPLTHNHMWVDDSAACSTLDFALRIFVPDIDLSSWHLRERQCAAAGFGRSYTDGRLWDEKGTLVASMTQQSILRRLPVAQSKEKL